MMRRHWMLMLVLVVSLIGAPAAGAQEAPDGDDVPELFVPWEDVGLDPLVELDREEITTVQQPDHWLQPSFQRYFGSTLTNGIDNPSAVARLKTSRRDNRAARYSRSKSSRASRCSTAVAPLAQSAHRWLRPR